MSVKEVRVQRCREDRLSPRPDLLAVEEPLEIRLAWGKGGKRQEKALSVTMRTPGADADLALGFLFTEGIIRSAADVLATKYPARQLDPAAQRNVVLLELDPAVAIDLDRLDRHFYTSSSCGVCGKASLEMVQQTVAHFPRKGIPSLPLSLLQTLPEKLGDAQALFTRTGGIHATGIFDAAGNLLLLREDVGRHNAMDKAIGACLQEGGIPLSENIALVSGRASFELVQKALMAGLPILAAVGAPSSLAVELAEDYGMTLIGFLRKDSFNIYCGQERILEN